MSCNIIKEYVEFTKKNYLEYTKKIMGKYFQKEIFDQYLKTYIDTRYYQENEEVKATLEANINYYLNQTYENIPTKTSKFILELFKMFYYLDGIKTFKQQDDIDLYIKEINQIRITKLNIKEEDFISTFYKLIKENEKRKQKFLDSFDTNDFYLKQKKVPYKNIYDITIEHNIKFPKLYSNYAINKVYNENLIAENKIFIEYYLVNKKLLENIKLGNLKKEYLVEFNPNLFTKKDKLKSLLNIMDNDIAKELISLKITYQDFYENKDEVYEYISKGFNFSIILDKYYKEHLPEPTSLDIFRYIIAPDDSYKSTSLNTKNKVIRN